MRPFLLSLLVLASACLIPGSASVQAPPESRKRGVENNPAQVQEVVRSAVPLLIQMQKKDGGWPWNRSGGSIAITSIVAEALLLAAPDDPKARTAVQRALAYVLKQLDAVGVRRRTWDHAFALEFLCQVRAQQRGGEHQKQVAAWIPRLVEQLIKDQFPGGGWGHTKGDGPFSFATGPVVYPLLWARSQGENIPDAIFERARQSLEAARLPNGAFVYGGTAKGKGARKDKINSLPGSVARSAVCEPALVLLGGGSLKAVQGAVENFFWNWEELEKRQGDEPVRHDGPYLIGTHFISYAYRYVGGAIQLLPEKERMQKQDRLRKLLLQARNDDGTWNEDNEEQNRSYGTAMVVLALLSDKVLPPKWTKKP